MFKKDIYKIVGKNIQRERISKGYTQETFAELMNCSWSYVSKIESGILNLSIGKIYDICQYLKTDVQKVLTIK